MTLPVHLRARSHYSFLEGLASPQALAKAAAGAGQPALALVDRRGLTGAIEFYQACQQAGVRPLLGLEVDVALSEGANNLAPDTGSFAFLALDLQGWASLCRLSSYVLGELPSGSDRPVPLEILGQNCLGLLCLTGGSRGILARLLRGRDPAAAASWLGLLRDLFPDRLYVEIQRHFPEDQELAVRHAMLAQRLKIPTAATHSIYYLKPEEAPLQRVASAIRLNARLEDVPSEALAVPGACFLGSEEMEHRFQDLPAALEGAAEAAERCRLELPLGVQHYPAMSLPEGTTPEIVLREKAALGARRLYGEITPEIQSRLDHELAVINRQGYASLFLIMEEIVQFARQTGVPLSSRGSAASSLVAHCLDITSPDPLRLNLYFERFLNPARATPPDIDTDLCSRRRDSVIAHVYRTYGEERVAMVCTINRFRRRSALREVAKVYGLPSDEIKLLADSLPHRWWGPLHTGEDDAPFAELQERYTTPRHRAIFQDAEALLGKPHHLSIHPGGVVIAPGPITNLAPTALAAKGVVITQFDLDGIERLGMVKMDLLGIRGLTVLGDVAEVIHRRQGRPDASPLDTLNAIPEDDQATAQVIRSARTIGCFQIESPGMRTTLREVQARSVDDIMVALALYRPGPLTGGLKDAFVRRHRGLEPPEQLHPALTPLLSDTYGVILYQEQVLRIAHELGGFSLADADLLRRAMSHFDPGKQMQRLKEKFMAGAWERSQVPPEIAEQVWGLMAAFAGYGFPKAHAASYAVVAWRAAWCKVHYPEFFMAAVLANWGGYYGQRVYLTEARRMGLALRPPHVNYARSEFSVATLAGRPVLFMGLDQVRDLTRRTQERILRLRPFHSLDDFLARVDPRPVEAENLVKVGALAGFGAIPAMLAELASAGRRRGQLSLFSFGSGPQPAEDWSLAQRVAAQEELLGASVDAHLLELLEGPIAGAGALTTLDAAAHPGQRVRVAGMRQTWRRVPTAQGDFIYFMTLEDLEGMLDVVIFSDVYRRSRHALRESGPYIVEGEVQLDAGAGEPFLRAENIWVIPKA